jgi:hypothetical protein
VELAVVEQAGEWVAPSTVGVLVEQLRVVERDRGVLGERAQGRLILGRQLRRSRQQQDPQPAATREQLNPRLVAAAEACGQADRRAQGREQTSHLALDSVHAVVLACGRGEVAKSVEELLLALIHVRVNRPWRLVPCWPRGQDSLASGPEGATFSPNT